MTKILALLNSAGMLIEKASALMILGEGNAGRVAAIQALAASLGLRMESSAG